jgi:RNA polymerase sigma-70 factor (ECF subfamily)
VTTTGPEGFADFYAGSRARLLRVLVAMAGDVGEAEDALQEAFVRTAARWRVVRRYDDPEAFTRKVAQNLLRDSHRRRRRRDRAYRRVGPSATVTGGDPTAVLVVSALRSLPAAQREAIALHYLLDMPVAAVARELGRPENTVKSDLSRGRAALAAALREEADHER